MHLLYLNLFFLSIDQSQAKPCCFEYIKQLYNKPRSFDKGLIENKTANLKYDNKGLKVLDGKY